MAGPIGRFKGEGGTAPQRRWAVAAMAGLLVIVLLTVKGQKKNKTQNPRLSLQRRCMNVQNKVKGIVQF